MEENGTNLPTRQSTARNIEIASKASVVSKKRKSEVDGVSAQPKRSRGQNDSNEGKNCKVDKAVLMLNQEISKAGKRRKLGDAIRYFNLIREKRLSPTVVSYTSVINACVRCGQPQIANSLFKEMLSSNVQPNVVTFTSLLKGCINASNMSGSLDILLDMCRRKVVINSRTLNTFLRGCTRTGNCDGGLSILRSAYESWYESPSSPKPYPPIDGHSFTEVVKLLAQSFRFHEAHMVMKWHSHFVSAQTDIAQSSMRLSLGYSAFVDLATSYCMMGNSSFAKKYYKKFKKAADKKGCYEDVEGAGDDSTTAASLALFAEHRHEELKRRGDRLLQHIELLEDVNTPFERLSEYFMRVLIFPLDESVLSPDGCLRLRNLFSQKSEEELAGQSPSKESVPQSVSEKDISTWYSFNHSKELSNKTIKGLNLLRHLKGFGVFNVNDSPVEEEEGKDNILIPLHAPLRRFAKKYSTLTSDSGAFSFVDIFGNHNPVNLEICSGTGDWIIQKAKDNPLVNWTAMELRHDRCQAIFTQLVLEGVKNCCIIGGDATVLLRDKIDTGSIQNAFINFPEPPTFFDSRCHIFNAAFFTSLNRALVKGGTVTVVSDSDSYTRILSQEITSLKSLYRLCHQPPYSKGLPAEYPESSSYFDRFWSHGGKAQRMHITAISL